MEENKQTRKYILDIEGEKITEMPEIRLPSLIENNYLRKKEEYDESSAASKSYKIQKQDWKGIESGEWTGEIELVHQMLIVTFNINGEGWEWIHVKSDIYESIPFEHHRRIIARPLPGLQAPEVVNEKDNAIEILKELCQLKHYKDTVGKDSFYEKTQPLLWKRANDFLNSISKTFMEPNK